MKKYNLITRKLPRRARSERRRETSQGGGGLTTTIGGGASVKDPNSHTHGNKEYLDQITTDSDDYLYLTQRHGEDQHLEKNKVKSGFADEAHQLSEDSPTRKEFLSRLNDDVAKGKITFEQMIKVLGLSIIGGVHSGDAKGKDTFEPGGLTGKGFGLFTDLNGDTNLEVDNIVARRKFTVNVLEIQKETFAGGNINLTQANGTVFRVYGFDDSGYATITMFGAEDADGNMVVLSVSDAEGQTFLGHTTPSGTATGRPSWYKLYFMREDDAVTVDDMWHMGDMALVKTLNLSRGQRSWHRVVLDHGVEQLEDGKDYNYIIVSNSDELIDVTSEDGKITVHGVKAYDDMLDNSEPVIGDKVVQVGSVTEVVRMGVTRIDSRGDGFGGMYVVEGIGKNIGTTEQFRPTREPIVITPKRVHIDADDISFVTRNEKGEIVSSDDVGNMISSIDMKADGIKLKVGLDGGRNLLRGTKHLDSENIVLAPDTSGSEIYKDFTTANNEALGNDYVDVITYNRLRLEPSTVYVLSFMYLSNPGTEFETYIYNADVRVCDYVKNNQTNMETSEADGHSHFEVSERMWKLGTVEFKTTKDITDDTEVTVIVGRIFPISGSVNFGTFCAPKIEYGAEATQWRPSDDDSVTDGNLLDTGIDIKHKKIIITSDKVVVQNNAGETTALIDETGQITAALIDAVKMVTDVLAAERVVADNLIIGGNSEFGNFKTSTSGDIVNRNSNDTGREMSMATDALTYIKKTMAGIIQKIVFGHCDVDNNSEAGNYISMASPVTKLKRLIGQYIDVKKTEALHRDDLPNVGLWIESGVTVGLRPRVRRVHGGAEPVQLTKEDFTVLLTGLQKVDVVLPRKADIQDGQRIEIRACDAVDNSITADAALSDGGRVDNGRMKSYVYDEVNEIWWVNTFN